MTQRVILHRRNEVPSCVRRWDPECASNTCRLKTAVSGAFKMNNYSGEDRFIYNPGTKRLARLGADSYVHYPIDPKVGFRIMLPSEISETRDNSSGYTLKGVLKRLWHW